MKLNMKLNIQLFASGESSVFTDSPLQMKITWSSTPNEEVQNTSNVTARIYGRRTSGSTKGRQWNGYMNIGGNIHNFSHIYTDTSTSVGTSWVLMAYYTDTITHENDGSKTITIYGGLGGPSGTSLASKWCEGSTTATLDQLASPATLNSVNIDNFVSQGKFTPNFTINQQGLYYAMYIISYTPIELIVSWNAPIPVSNGVEATLTDAQKQTLWNVLDGKTNRTANDIKFVLGSYTDSGLTNQVGATDIDFVNSIAIPSYSLQWDSATLGDTGMGTYYGGHPLYYYVNDMNSTFIKTLSTPYLSFSASSTTGYLYGKTITYTINGVSRTSPYEDTSWSGGNTYTLTASDGRVDSITTTLSKNVIDYFVPYLSNIRVVRPIPTGDKVRVSYTANYYDGTGLINLTSAVYNFYYRESESDAWTLASSLSGTGTNGTATFTNVDISGMNYKKPFYYKIEFTDRIGNTTQVYPYTSNIPKGLPVWNAYTDSSDTNVLNVNGKLNIEDTSPLLQLNGVTSLKRGGSGATILSTNTYPIYFRPNGDGSTYGQVTIETNGRLTAPAIVSGSNIGADSIELTHATPYIDFHYNNSTGDYTSRIIEDASGLLGMRNALNVDGNLQARSNVQVLKALRGMHFIDNQGDYATKYVTLDASMFNYGGGAAAVLIIVTGWTQSQSSQASLYLLSWSGWSLSFSVLNTIIQGHGNCTMTRNSDGTITLTITGSAYNIISLI